MMDCQSQRATEASIKTYFLDKDDKVTEIRRFLLPYPASASLMVDKIRALYNIDCSQQVRTQWLDSEGDRVTFTTDEELTDALAAAAAPGDSGDADNGSVGGNGSGGTLRVYVSSPPVLVPAASNSVVHPDVVCDGCEQQVRGYRFKCIMCTDFDLCCHCVVLNRHCEHPMLLLRRPRDPFICRLSKWNRSYWARRCRLGGDGAAGSSGCGAGSSGGGVGGGGVGGGGGSSGDCAGLPSDCMKFLRHLEASAMKVLQQQQQQQQTSSAMFPFTGSSPASLDAAVSADFSRQRCDSVNSNVLAAGFGDCGGGVGGDGAGGKTQEMLRFVHSMSSSLNALLQPLGIDVSYHASQGSPERGASAEEAVARQQASLCEQQQQQQQQQQAQQGGDCAMAGDEAGSAPAAAAAAASASAAAGDETTMATSSRSTSASGLRLPILPDHVAKALDQMQAMGFTDDGGRLSELLLSADGDIDRVLDALRQS